MSDTTHTSQPAQSTHVGSHASGKNILIASVLSLAFISQIWQFVRVAWFFIQYPPISDSAYFVTVGRALLNGLKLYTDIIEPKPPLIFWLTALSLKTGHPNLYLIIQMCLLLSLAPVIAFFIYRTTRDKLAVGCAALLGITVAFEMAVRASGFMPEGFGAPIALFSILLFAYPSGNKRLLTILSGVAIGSAAMFKEPFVASTVLGMLVFCRSRQDFLRIALILCIGGMTGLLILLCSGSFSTYFTLYLPDVFGSRSAGSIIIPDYGNRLYYVIPASGWMRTLDLHKIFTSYVLPGRAVFFALFLFVCTGLLAPLRTTVNRSALIFSSGLVLITLACAHQLFSFYQLLFLYHRSGHLDPLMSWIFGTINGPLVGGILFWTLALLLQGLPPKRTQLFTVAVIFGLFLSSVLVAFGGNYEQNHLLFSAPPLIAVCLYCIWRSVETKNAIILGSLSLLLALNTFTPGKVQKQIGGWDHKRSVADGWPESARKLDAIMDACHIDRYFLTYRDRQLLPPYTTHSPYQIFYGMVLATGDRGIEWNSTPNPYFAKKFADDLAHTSIIITRPEDDPNAPQAIVFTGAILPMDRKENFPSKLPAIVIPVLQKDFTLQRPPCAKGLPPIENLKVYFRKGYAP